jgi:SAM-dependent methyltransferase
MNKSISPNNSLANPQQGAFESIFSTKIDEWSYHDTPDPLTRYLRDRRLNLALKIITPFFSNPLQEISILLACGGVGGEATFFANKGFSDVTNSDFSENALALCRQRDPRLKTAQIDAESINLPDSSFDWVIVQDGLHHLPRPVLGLNEMIRVARRGVIVLEPHRGLSAKLLGREWERLDSAVNYVFRWDQSLFRQVILSQLLESPKVIKTIRLWDHGSAVMNIVKRLHISNGTWAARFIYGLLTPFNFLGNNFVGILVKTSSQAAPSSSP